MGRRPIINRLAAFCHEIGRSTHDDLCLLGRKPQASGSTAHRRECLDTQIEEVP